MRAVTEYVVCGNPLLRESIAPFHGSAIRCRRVKNDSMMGKIQVVPGGRVTERPATSLELDFRIHAKEESSR
eukprot:scaffold3568_cov380-Prasinococcus_capsulatus_cf.AAC.3